MATGKRLGEAIDEDASSREMKKMRASINDAAADLLCPISQELPVDPCIAEDGQIYERGAIVEWLSRNATSPITRAPMGTKLLPAVPVRNTIGSLIKSGAIEGELAEAWREKLENKLKVKEVGLKAEGGDGTAMWQLGLWYDFGRQGLPIDAVQSRAWYERSAAARDPKGMAAFGDALLCGWGGPQNTALGLVMASQAAELGSDLGAYILGQAFFKGQWGLAKDFVRARFWLKKIVDGECEHKNLRDPARNKLYPWLRELDGR